MRLRLFFLLVFVLVFNGGFSQSHDPQNVELGLVSHVNRFGFFLGPQAAWKQGEWNWNLALTADWTKTAEGKGPKGLRLGCRRAFDIALEGFSVEAITFVHFSHNRLTSHQLLEGNVGYGWSWQKGALAFRHHFFGGVALSQFRFPNQTTRHWLWNPGTSFSISYALNWKALRFVKKP